MRGADDLQLTDMAKNMVASGAGVDGDGFAGAFMKGSIGNLQELLSDSEADDGTETIEDGDTKTRPHPQHLRYIHLHALAVLVASSAQTWLLDDRVDGWLLASGLGFQP